MPDQQSCFIRHQSLDSRLSILRPEAQNSQASRFGMRTLSLVNRNRHAEGANGPAGHDATHQDHGQLHGSALQDSAYGGQQGAELDGRFSSKTIDCQTGRQGSDSGCSDRTILVVDLCNQRVPCMASRARLTSTGKGTVDRSDD